MDRCVMVANHHHILLQSKKWWSYVSNPQYTLLDCTVQQWLLF
jgi:hypothetical protein